MPMVPASNLEIRLNTAAARVSVVVAFCLAFALFSYRVSCIAWAAEQLESTDQHSISRALAVDDQNPALHNWAGVIYLNGDHPQPERAFREFRRATELNSRISDYWENLGRACFFMNDLKCAEDAYVHAVVTAPRQLSVLNELAMYYVATGNIEKALPHFRRQLELDPESANSVLSVCLRTLSPELVWTKIVREQAKSSVKFEFFQILLLHKMNQATPALWEDFMSSHSIISLEDAKSYLDILEGEHDYAELSRVWQDLERMHASKMPIRSANNLVVNGGFEQAPTNVGLDWHISPEQFLDTQVVMSDQGNALQFDFTVAHNSEHDSAYQFVSVKPNLTYEVHARVRSQDITSDSGPRLHVTDPNCAECVNESSGGTTGTTEWHDIATTFTTGTATQIVRLSVWRPRSRSFPTEIQGQFWLDDVSIRAVN